VHLALAKIRHLTKAAVLGRRLRREYGVKGTGIMGLVYGQSDLNIVYTSRHFQPCADTFDDRFQFVGPSIGSRTETLDLPWGEPSHIPVIYVSLGTLFNADPAFYQCCFEAFRGQNVRVIMSIGNTVAEESLGAPPANVTVRAFVPQLDVLRRTSVFVSHGGMNSVSESLAYGVPLICVPQMGEQEMVARQVEALGAGLYLAKSEVTAARLRESVQRVLDDDAFRRQAAVVRQSFEAAGGPPRGADAILAFTRRRTAKGAA
jgi:MGT family glycosyltransferase